MMTQVETRTPDSAASAAGPVIVYYDGSCPLCTAEICYYQARRGGDAVTWVDVSAVPLDAEVAPGLTRSAAMARFHVRDGDGRLRSGADGFATLWRALPAFAVVGQIAGLPGIRHVLELAYRGFLPVRPVLSAAFRRLSRRTPRA
jgi:predicted DCC family thiol-disulfide oxidoreductase YuxK